MIEQAPKVTFTPKTFALANKPNVVLKIKEINNEYLFWDKIKYKNIDDLDPKQIWSIVKISREFNYKNLTFGKYNFNYVSTDYIQKILHYFDMNIGGYMGAKSIIPDADKTRYLVSSIMEEAISSSQMEGASTTRKKAKEMIQQEKKPRNKSEQMIMNNYITMKHIVQLKSDEISPEKILYLHKLITNGTLDDIEDEGMFRNNNDVHVVNHVNSEIVHTPPSHEEFNDLIKDLCDFFNNDNQNFIHPIIKGCIIHFMIGWIHPFSDGNGRTARALFYWYLLKKGYWLTEYLSISKINSDRKSVV